jgi:predicted short-subunit dehydrogenase-like oxidoreductase (DUF2520 family)
MKKQTVAIVGTGNVARALAVALHDSGVRVTEIIGRNTKKTAKLAREVKARAATLSNAKVDANIIWICVSDGAIAEVAGQLAKLPISWKGKTVLHASGALTAAELKPLKNRGAATASFHPMNTFVPAASGELAGTPFGAEGDERAIRQAARLTQHINKYPAPVYRIRTKDKPLYHALGAFTSPLMISALNVAERIGRSIGIKEPRHLMTPILLSTINNFLREGTSGAFSGPIRRGDPTTIRKHLAALKRIPNGEQLYRALALNAVEHLPSKNQAEIRKLLKGSRKK